MHNQNNIYLFSSDPVKVQKHWTPCFMPKRTEMIIQQQHQLRCDFQVVEDSRAMCLLGGHNILRMLWLSVPCRSSLHGSDHLQSHKAGRLPMHMLDWLDQLSWTELCSTCSKNINIFTIKIIIIHYPCHRDWTKK